MKTAHLGYEVYVDYDGVLETGEIFESTRETETLNFVIGTATVLPAFEEAVIGMQEGEQRSVIMQPKDAFGDYQPELVQEIDKAIFGERATELQVGMVLNLNLDKQGQKVPALVTAVNAGTITVDYNHPLAGKVVEYRLTLKKIGKKKYNLPPMSPGQTEN